MKVVFCKHVTRYKGQGQGQMQRQGRKFTLIYAMDQQMKSTVLGLFFVEFGNSQKNSVHEQRVSSDSVGINSGNGQVEEDG